MEQNNNLPLITQDKVLARMNIALTQKQLSVQKLQDEADSLEFTEDNIPAISAYLTKLNTIDKVTEEVHKEVKAPFLEGGRVVDAAKNSNLSLTAAIRTPVKAKFDKLCADVERKKAEARKETERQAAILAGIENNVIGFSAKIAACTTNAEIIAIENLINLEKSESRASKYGEFHKQAVDKYDTVLKPILKNQKGKIKEKEALEKQIKDAEEANNPVLLDELNEKKEKVEDEIQQNAVKVQEEALNNAPIEHIPDAEEIFADTKFRRTYTIEVADEKEAFKKAKDLLEISVNKTAANVVLQTLKDTGAFKEKADVILNGIKYSEIKNYK